MEYKSTPFIGDDLYTRLPALLKRGAAEFSDKRERDVFLLSALTTLGGVFTNVSGNYGQSHHYTTLYLFVCAEAASGKGSMTFAKQLIEPLSDYLSNSSAGFTSNGVNALREQKNLRWARGERILISGNASSAALQQRLNALGGRGIIFSTEADTLSSSLGQDWGNFSDLLRKGFHHEYVDSLRVNQGSNTVIPNPRFSVALAGTPQQLPLLLKSVENGLVSRFLFYVFSTEFEWRDMTPTTNADGQSTQDVFRLLGAELLEFFKRIEVCELQVELSPRQWEEFNRSYDAGVKKLKKEGMSYLRSSIVRLATITHRVAMILSVLRLMDEKGEIGNRQSISCSDLDLKLAFQITMPLVHHLIAVYKSLDSAKPTKTDVSSKLLDILPEGVEFSRKEAQSYAHQLGYSKRSIDSALQKLRDIGKLEQPKSGFYFLPKEEDQP